jgi:hypothetical protein
VKNNISLWCAVLAASLSFSGCSVIGHTRVADWPELKVLEHHVAHQEMRDRCTRFVGPFMTPEGCTVFYMDQGEAHIFVSKDFPSRLVLEHERMHAAGYDHIGSSNMRQILARWKARVEARRLLALRSN